MSKGFAVLNSLPKVALDTLRWGAKDIHSRIEATMIATWKFRVRRVDQPRCSPCRDNRQLVFESLSTAEVSCRKVGEDLSLNVIKIKPNYDPTDWILAAWRLCVGQERMETTFHDWVNYRRNVLIKLPSSHSIGSLRGGE